MRTSIKIDKGIAIPIRGLEAQQQYPLAQLGVGDSFFVPADKAGARGSLVAALIQAFYRRAGRQGSEGVRFTIRKVVGGYRVWRKE
jgi:hypothetical protein